jgi:hypothetical protein
LLHHQDSPESSESTAKIGLNTLNKIIYDIHIRLVACMIRCAAPAACSSFEAAAPVLNFQIQIQIQI